MEHKGSDESFDDWALGLSESLLLVSSGGMGYENFALGLRNCDVIDKARVSHGKVVIPLSEELWDCGVNVLFF